MNWTEAICSWAHWFRRRKLATGIDSKNGQLSAAGELSSLILVANSSRGNAQTVLLYSRVVNPF